MKERSIGIRDLKAKLSECVGEVKRGATIIVTEHGKRVARLVPEGESLEVRLDMLKSAGAIAWSGRRLGHVRPDVRAHGKQTVADLVAENRE